MTLTPGHRSRTCFASSCPLISGMTTSVSRTSMSFVCDFSNEASSSRRCTLITVYPACLRMVSPSSRSRGSSSARRIVAGPRWLDPFIDKRVQFLRRRTRRPHSLALHRELCTRHWVCGRGDSVGQIGNEVGFGVNLSDNAGGLRDLISGTAWPQDPDRPVSF